jgi:hypothetical protein
MKRGHAYPYDPLTPVIFTSIWNKFRQSGLRTTAMPNDVMANRQSEYMKVI